MTQGKGEPVAVTGQTLTASINNCFGCGDTHHNIECKPYKNPQPPYTHWFMCPTAQEPVGVGLVMRSKTPDEILEMHHRAMMSMAATVGHPFMFAIARMVDDRVDVVQHSYFPHDRKLEAVEKLHKLLVETMPPKEPLVPLKRASQESLMLFGAKTIPAKEAIEQGLVHAGPSAVQQAGQNALQGVADFVAKNIGKQVDEQICATGSAEPGKG